MKSSIYILLILSFLAFGCEKVIDIDIPDKDRKFVLNGLINPDSLYSVNVSKSLNILDSKDVKFIDDAKVDVFINDEFYETLNILSRGDYISNSLYPIPGNKYSLEVSNSTIEMAKVDVIIPQKSVNQIIIDTVSIFYEDNDIGVIESEVYNNEYLQCTIEFNDPSDEENYYWFNVTGLRAIYHWNPITFEDSVSIQEASLYFNSDDPIIEGWVNWGDQGFVFSDKLINGQNTEFDINLDKYLFYDIDTNMVYFNLNLISEDFYLYALTHDAHLNAQDNAFTEPVQVYTNVENGYGIFSGYQTVKDSIEVISQHTWDDFR